MYQVYQENERLTGDSLPPAKLTWVLYPRTNSANSTLPIITSPCDGNASFTGTRILGAFNNGTAAPPNTDNIFTVY